MKKIQRAVLVLFAALMLFVSVSCGASTPEAQLKKDIRDFKKADAASASIDASSLSDENKESYKKFLKMTQEFDYTIGESELSKDGNSAKLQLIVTSYDFGTAYLDAWDAIIKKGKKLDEDGFYAIFFEKALALDETDYVTALTISCKKGEDGKWTTDLAENSNFRNAIMGDMINIVKALANE